MSDSKGWIGVDLDGTLAFYDEWRGVHHIGPPIPVMVNRVKSWIADGLEVRIFTARVAPDQGRDRDEARAFITQWCLLHIGKSLPVTHEKDFEMVALWDDRCVRVETNTGRIV